MGSVRAAVGENLRDVAGVNYRGFWKEGFNAETQRTAIGHRSKRIKRIKS
jgi:hypothetical protein